MIKMLHIHTLPVISGSGINTFLTMRGMKKDGYDVELACAPGGPLIDLVRGHGMKVTTFPHLVQPLHPLMDPLALLSLTLFLMKVSYQIVHTHNSKAGFLGRLAARLAGVPVIVHTVHGFAFHDLEPRWRRMLFRNLERLASHWCDRMIFISQPLIDWALKERVVHQRKVVKIYSGIELDRFLPVSAPERYLIREKWGMGAGDAVIGIVSKLWEGKGHATLIRAFKEIKKEIPTAKLIIVGEGHLRESLIHQVQGLDLSDSVLFTGFLADISEMVATLDVAVLPSFFEGMGRVLLEAMAMGKPVVATRVGGIPDLVEHGANGLLVSPGDVTGLREAITRILRDKGLAERMGREGRKRVTDRFSADRMVSEIGAVYREILQAKGVQLGD
jgi:glycosyltransferase involved in cell wall biosynthesis